MQERKARENQKPTSSGNDSSLNEMFETVFIRAKSYMKKPKTAIIIIASLVLWAVFSLYLPIDLGNYKSMVQLESDFFTFYSITLGFLIVAYTSSFSLLGFRINNARPEEKKI